MKKLILFLIIISLIIIGIFYIYERYFISHLSDAIIEEEIPEVVPENFRENAVVLKRELSQKSDVIAKYLHQNDVPLTDFITLIDNVEYYEVEKFMHNVKSEKFKNANQAFDFIAQYFELSDVPIEDFRDDFVKHYDPEKFKELLNFFEQNKKQAPMMFPVAKETFKKLITEEYANMEKP